MIEMPLSSRHRTRNLRPGGLKAEHATSRSRRLPTILTPGNKRDIQDGLQFEWLRGKVIQILNWIRYC